MVMTLIKGPVLFGVSGGNNNNNHDGVSHVLFGSILLFAGCLGCAIFVNLQAITLKSYPATLSLTSLVCLMGALEGLGMTFIMEETHFNAAWLVFKWDMNLLSAIYAGIVCSGIGYFLKGVIMKEKGPVFLTTFNPLCMVIAAVVSFFLFGVEILLGRVNGAFIVCLGLFSVVWGKSGDINNSSRAKDEMNSEELKEAHCENSGDELRETHRENSGDGLRETHRESSGDEITVEPVIDQNLFILRIHHTTATNAAAMSNIIPALTFVLAFFLRLETINVGNRGCQAKLLGALVTILGAMVMTLIKGPVLFGVSGGNNNNNHDGVSHVLFGSIFIFAGCLGCAIFVNLQAITLKSYPATLSLTSLVCLMGALEGLEMAFIMEETHFNAAWLVFKWDMNLLSAIYGIVCSGIGYFLEGVIMKEKGPVFLTTFNPLCMVIAAVVSFFLFGEEILLGRAIGAFILCLGLFSVVWGKSGDINNSSRAKDEMNSEELKEAHCENSGDELRETHRENSGDGLRDTP
ncbi:uncharacterized protein LOC131638057 [Vicia villosa]|uniref:uncharacterized protein LOC131638057 n=1 Tax=Vicia villosa TaxID=3911 RepID=UPI00273C174A|nr:uncharacterized protein LOC131638057 [Vicia villosa]